MIRQHLKSDFEWLLTQTVVSCRAALEFDQHVCLSEFFELLSGRTAYLPAGVKLPRRLAFERSLDAGAYEGAALSLLSRESAYLISKPSNGSGLATILLEGMENEVTESCATVALSISAAIAQAIIAEMAR